MARRKINISKDAVTPGTGTQNALLLVAGSNSPLSLTKLGFGPIGTNNAADRIVYALYRGSTATPGGTAMNATQVGGTGKDVGAVQASGSIAPTGVTAGAKICKRGVLLPNAPAEIPLNIDLDPGEKLLMTTTCATSFTAEINFEGEE